MLIQEKKKREIITISLIFFIFTGLVRTSLFFSSSRFLQNKKKTQVQLLENSVTTLEVRGQRWTYEPDLEQGVLPDLSSQIEAGSRGGGVENGPGQEARLS